MATTEHRDPTYRPGDGASSERVLTATGARLIGEEIDRLRAQKEDEFAQRLREAGRAASWGDEDEYHAIKEDEAVLDARIARLEALLRHATVIEDHPDGGDGLIGIGSIAVVEDLSSGRTARYELVGWHDGTRPKTVSAASPVGQALLGRAAGERVVVELPDGRSRELRIVEVEDPAR
jgi:transcription elongation factor GreA